MKVLDMIEQKDGSVIMNYKLTKKELGLIKKISGKKILTNDDINVIILQAMKDGIKSESKKDKKTKS